MAHPTIQSVTEELVRKKFPQILAKWQNKPLRFDFDFPKSMEDKPEVRLSLYVGGIQMKYTLLFPLTFESVKMEKLEKII